MFSLPELTIAYIKRRPASAARVLASLPPEDAAAFLQEIPTRFAVDAVAHMHPWPASLVIQQMGVTSGAAILRELGFADAAKILRLVDPPDRRQFLADLPRRLRRDFESSLAFATGTVGAHMTTTVATLESSESVAAALDLVKQAERGNVEVIFVVDERKRLVGAVTLAALLRHPANTALAELLDTSCTALSAHARLDTVAGLDTWHDYNRLPVVSRRGELIGAISRQALRRADQAAVADMHTGAPSLAESMTEALAASVMGLVDLLGDSSGDRQLPGADHGH